jgi:hypothetical protein
MTIAADLIILLSVQCRRDSARAIRRVDAPPAASVQIVRGAVFPPAPRTDSFAQCIRATTYAALDDVVARGARVGPRFAYDIGAGPEEIFVINPAQPEATAAPAFVLPCLVFVRRNGVQWVTTSIGTFEPGYLWPYAATTSILDGVRYSVILWWYVESESERQDPAVDPRHQPAGGSSIFYRVYNFDPTYHRAPYDSHELQAPPDYALFGSLDLDPAVRPTLEQPVANGPVYVHSGRWEGVFSANDVSATRRLHEVRTSRGGELPLDLFESESGAPLGSLERDH